MSFKQAKKGVLQALLEGCYQHEARQAVASKNLLQTGEISSQQLFNFIQACRGDDHSQSQHHREPSITVHVLRRADWYVKFYFLAPDTWFISVHRQTNT